MLRLFKFKLRFFWAGLREIRGDYIGAAALLDLNDVPTGWRSLNDMYRIRMLVLGNSPTEGPRILKTAEKLPWFQEPCSQGDRYAKEYWNYMMAGVTGNVPARQLSENKLKTISVGRIYRNSLRITLLASN